jgi:hypothetical protein
VTLDELRSAPLSCGPKCDRDAMMIIPHHDAVVIECGTCQRATPILPPAEARAAWGQIQKKYRRIEWTS